MSAGYRLSGVALSKRKLFVLNRYPRRFFEHVVDETPNDAFHDSFYDLSNAFFGALARFFHRYHHLP